MSAAVRSSLWFRVADAVILVCALIIAGIGILVLTTPQQSDAYSNAPKCASITDSFHQRCYALVPVNAVATETHPSKLREPQDQITVTSSELPASPLVITVIQPPASFYALERNQRSHAAYMKVWNGIPTAIYIARSTTDTSFNSSGAVRTDSSPYWQDDIDTWGGWALTGVGLTLLLVHPVWWLMPRAVRARVHRVRPAWRTTPGGVSGLISDPRLRVAVVALVGLNLLDIATSLIGAKHNLFEGNPVAATMVAAWGPLGGFFSLKLPALVAIVLALTKLPARIALPVAWGACGIMAWVVVNNLVLTWSVATPV